MPTDASIGARLKEERKRARGWRSKGAPTRPATAGSTTKTAIVPSGRRSELLLGNPRLLPYQISYRRIEDPRELDQLLDLERSATALPLADLDLLHTDGVAQLSLLEAALDATYLDPMSDFLSNL